VEARFAGSDPGGIRTEADCPGCAEFIGRLTVERCFRWQRVCRMLERAGWAANRSDRSYGRDRASGQGGGFGVCTGEGCGQAGEYGSVFTDQACQ